MADNNAAPRSRSKKKRSTKKKRGKTTPKPKPPPAVTNAASINIEQVAFTDVNPAVYNPRADLQPGDAAYERLANSLDDDVGFGYIDPLVFNKRTGNLVGGHQRFKILKAKGYDAADMSVVDVDETTEREMNIVLNNPAGKWDQVKLASLLLDIRDTRGNTDRTGFDPRTALNIIALHNAKEEPANTQPALGAMEYRVIVDCNDEHHQAELLTKLKEDGLSCRALIS